MIFFMLFLVSLVLFLGWYALPRILKKKGVKLESTKKIYIFIGAYFTAGIIMYVNVIYQFLVWTGAEGFSRIFFTIVLAPTIGYGVNKTIAVWRKYKVAKGLKRDFKAISEKVFDFNK